MRSIRSCSRARTDSERGFALVWALGIAILFFLLIQLVLIDSQRELAEARRFRARIIAATLAENGAELAATRLIDDPRAGVVGAEDWQGTMSGNVLSLSGPTFVILGEGEAKGTSPTKASVTVYGQVSGNQIHINYTVHKP